MIVKKPYAFLIKHFRIIHGILFVLLGYIMLKSADISSFFSDYASKQYFVKFDGERRARRRDLLYHDGSF